MADAKARRAVPAVRFNGKNVDKTLENYLEEFEYTDVAGGGSDSISILLQNITMKWLRGWYPKKGDRMSAHIAFRDWNKTGKNLRINCGRFVLDGVKHTGGPLRVMIEGLSIPASESFKTRERTKTWKKVTVAQIGQEIAKRYGLEFKYDADTIKINAVEQNEKTDSAFLDDICKKYGLAIKVFLDQIIIFDKGRYEKKKAVATIYRRSFVEDDWEYIDTLEGTYTGGRISYKSGKDNKEISTYLGIVKENAKNARTLKINEQADDINDAKRKIAAKVNESNEQAVTLTGTIWPNVKVVAGATINVKDLGKANGKYFIDKVTTKITGNGTTMNVEMHKCQKRLNYAATAK